LLFPLLFILFITFGEEVAQRAARLGLAGGSRPPERCLPDGAAVLRGRSLFAFAQVLGQPRFEIELYLVQGLVKHLRSVDLGELGREDAVGRGGLPESARRRGG